MNRLSSLRMIWWNAAEASTHDRPGFEYAIRRYRSYGAIIDTIRGRRSE